MTRIFFRTTPLVVLLAGICLSACTSGSPQRRAVVMLIDTSGTYTEELNKARAIINYLLGTLESGEAMAVARIDSASFTEKDMVARATFSDKPSTSNAQKRAFKQTIDKFVKSANSSTHTDITGGILQATEFLKESGANHRYIVIFSDLAEDLVAGQVRDFPLPLEGVEIIAVNVTKLRSDNIDPRDYLQRVSSWETRVTRDGGRWRVVNDLERLDNMLQYDR